MAKRRRRGSPAVRATVIYGGSRGHGKKLWAYSYDEVAQAAGTTVAATRQAAHAGEFDPGDLGSVVEWVSKRRSKG